MPGWRLKMPLAMLEWEDGAELVEGSHAWRDPNPIARLIGPCWPWRRRTPENDADRTIWFGAA
jgi:hypothetical protein